MLLQLRRMELEDKTSSPPVFKQNFFFQDRQMVLETTTTKRRKGLIHLHMQNIVFLTWIKILCLGNKKRNYDLECF